MVHTDIISRILKEAEARDVEFTNELSTFLDDGITSILADRKEPYFTIAKNKIRHLISVDRPLSDPTRSDYTQKMLERLNKLYFNLEDEFGKTFVEICIQSVKEGEYLTTDTLSFLNEIYKSIRR